MTDETTITRPIQGSAGVLTWIARALLALVGVATLVGGIYFTFFASVEEGGVSTGVDWAVAIWSIAMSLAYVAAAVLLRPGRARVLWLTVGLVVLHLIFGLVKLIGYDELESVPFFVADLAILALLAFSRRAAR